MQEVIRPIKHRVNQTVLRFLGQTECAYDLSDATIMIDCSLVYASLKLGDMNARSGGQGHINVPFDVVSLPSVVHCSRANSVFPTHPQLVLTSPDVQDSIRSSTRQGLAGLRWI